MINQQLFTEAQTAFNNQQAEDNKNAEIELKEKKAEEERIKKEQSAVTAEWFKEIFSDADITSNIDGRYIQLSDRIIMFRPKYKGEAWRVNKTCINFDPQNDDEHKSVAETWIDDLSSLGRFLDQCKDKEICYNCERLAREASKPSPEISTTPAANSGAFPSRSRWEPAHEGYDLQETGLSKREYFAAKALQGILSGSISNEDLSNNFYVETAVRMADGLIAKLEGMPSPFEPTKFSS